MSHSKEIILPDGEKEVLRGIDYAIEHDIHEHSNGQSYSAKLSLDHYNKRIRILEYQADHIKPLVLAVRALAEANNFHKIIFMASEDDWELFLSQGYILEAIIRHYQKGDNAYVMSKFRSQERAVSAHLMEETTLIEGLMDHPPSPGETELPEGHQIRLAKREDIPELTNLYDRVFESYPTPLEKTEYMEKVFEVSSLFAIITFEQNIVAAASAEFLSRIGSAEITDCATLKEHRKKGLMTHLVRHLEAELKHRGYHCGFSMARAKSFGMNQVFYNLGYRYTGRVLNHCDIFGSFEDMNIWVKKLSDAYRPLK